MFAYCNNNAVNSSDSTGYYPGNGSDPLERLFPVIVDWYIDSDENETDKNGAPTFNAKLKRTVQALGRSVDFTFGIGLGMYAGASADDALSGSLGVYYDLIRIESSDGEIWTGQYFHDGADISLFYACAGIGRSAYKETGSDQWTWHSTEPDYGNLELGIGFYFIAGISASIGIDFFGFGAEFYEIWLE